MSDLLIAVGGSGQHVALAVARLARIGALEAPKAFVIDADRSALAASLESFGGTVSAGATHPFPGGATVVPPFDIDRGTTQFRSLFVDQDHPLEEELVELFFDEEAAGSGATGRQGLDVGRGMFGNPAVGSAVFASSRNKIMKPLFEVARGANRIFVVGSFLGGTGAGIIHQLARMVHREVDAKVRAQLFGAFLLRWFSLPPVQGLTVTPETLLASEGHGLQYFFKHTRNHLAASLLVGAPDDPGPSPLLALRPANPGNAETVNVFPLLAAYGLEMLPRKTDQQQGNKVYALAHEDSDHQGLWLLKQEWRKPANPSSRSAMLAARWQEAILLQQLYASFLDRRSDFVGFDYSGSRSTWGGLMKEEAKKHNVKVDLYAERVLNALIHRGRQLYFVTSWLEGIFGDLDLSVPVGNTADPMTKQLYADWRHRRWNHPLALNEVLVAAYQPVNDKKVELDPKLPPDYAMAEAIERGILYYLRKS
ncbi:MAG: hypothetical protein Q8Q09_22135 [Deltaproteobacteria bacterium]|nr:hypothetical protein [Deltaproteobacteria bacterium]